MTSEVFSEIHLQIHTRNFNRYISKLKFEKKIDFGAFKYESSKKADDIFEFSEMRPIP